MQSIVLVHGVNVWGNEKHAADTWTCDTPDGRVHWVRDFLPIYEETSRARVLAHEYDASAVWGTGPRAVGAEADRLLDWLHVQRKVCSSYFPRKNVLQNFLLTLLGLCRETYNLSGSQPRRSFSESGEFRAVPFEVSSYP
jgi:hypothetical protein